MKYYILCPAEVESGGPELAHQLCNELVRQNQDARMYYVYLGQRGPEDVECSEKYKKYQTEHVIDYMQVDRVDSVVIIPEELYEWIPVFQKAKKVLWWMSVDNFTKHVEKEDISTYIEKVDVHLVQSQYAKHYVIEELGRDAGKVLELSDYISEQYLQFCLPAQYRQDIVVFNPKKGYDVLLPFIEAMPSVKWIPLINLTEEKMIIVMQTSKVYVDFGGHPGKDRIPREAASCGCCIITNRRGSAAYAGDVPIPEDYKFENVESSHEEITDLIQDVFENYEEHFKRFQNYRDIIKQEREKFACDVQRFIQYMREE